VSAYETSAGLLEPFGYGRGFHDRILGVQPAAGANFARSLESQYATRVLAVNCQLVTGAAVANRWVELRFTDSDGGVWDRAGAGVFVLASSTVQLVWQIGRGSADFASGGADTTPIYAPLNDVFLAGSDQVRIVVGNIQAADQLSAIRLTVERFPTGRRGYPEGRAIAAPARLR